MDILNGDPFCDYEEDLLQMCMEATDVHNIQYLIFLQSIMWNDAHYLKE